MKDRLTKSAYLKYLECPPEFWLQYHQPLFVNEPYSLEYEHLRQQGYAVQQLAKKLDRFQPRDGMVVDHERVFQTKDLYARCDVVVTDEATGTIDIYDIKAAASVKPEYYDDLAFQRLAAERAGYAVGRCFVISMNGEYIRRGEIDTEAIFIATDITAQVAERMETTAQKARDAMEYLKTVPVPSLAEYCVANKLDCSFLKLHYPDLPDYTVFDITYLHHSVRRELLRREVVSIFDVPDDFPLPPRQRLQVKVAKSQTCVINHRAIAARIDSWEYPLHFLDYETFSYAIPQFDGVRPFQQMCFQYSLHTIDRPGAEPRHSYYLSRDDDDPPRAMAAHLKEAMSGGIGTVFVWYEAFEKGRNEEMIAMFPEFADFFIEVNEKTVDLMKIFSDGLYVHPDFRGRTSIKKVLPVVAPEMSYQSLSIQDGMTATISWFRARKWETMSQETRDTIFDNLERYCELDSMAMVAIFNKLVALKPEAEMALGT